MARVARKARRSAPQLSKAPTGITGLDEITFGGLPKGRPARDGRHHRRARGRPPDPPRAGGVRLRLRAPPRPPGAGRALIELVDAYVGPGAVLTGSARLAQEAEDRAAGLRRRQERTHLQGVLERKRLALEARVAALQAEFAAETRELEQQLAHEAAQAESVQEARASQAASRR